MTQVNFIFNIIVTRLHFSKNIIDNPEKLSVRVKFNNNLVTITASRINVTDFVPGRCTEGNTQPETLRLSLEKNGMPLTVLYGGISLGAAQVMFPQSFTDRIQIGMTDLIHAETCSIMRSNEEVGTVELLCYLTIKCELSTGLEEQEQKDVLAQCNKICANLGKTMNPADILFLMGDPHTIPTPCETCLEELEPEEGDERLKLDLDRYPSMKHRIMGPPEQITGMNACCQLKVMTEQCGKFIDSVVQKVSRLPSPMPDHETYHYAGWERTIPVPVGDMDVMGIKPIRFCPFCLNSMSWLPKYACCPKCGTKPMPLIDEGSEESLLTADQIVEQYTQKIPNTSNRFPDESNEEPKISSRCSCQLGKFCAHCRVRNIYKNIFMPSRSDKIIKSISDNDFRVIVTPEGTSSSKLRPYLDRVFSELQLIYDNSGSKNKSKSKKHCKRPLLEGHVSPNLHSKSLL